MRIRSLILYGGLVVLAAGAPTLLQARDAAFVEPGAITAKGGGEALTADPKLFEAGDSNVGIARRVTLFFANTGGVPLTVSDINATGDGNVTVQTTGNDCQKNGKLPAGSRCSVALAVTPTSAGPWSVEVLATHDGPGRIARAAVTGKATIDAKTASSGEGLNQNNKDAKPLEFGEVDINGDPVVRTTLMVNDSPEDLAIMAIDLIEVGKGLDHLAQGCVPDQVLKPGESCPITLRWAPPVQALLMTDLIIRHTGKSGFTVIPVRGHAFGGGETARADDSERLVRASAAHGVLPPPPPLPTAAQIEQAAVKIPPIAAQDITRSRRAGADDAVYFIGQVGDRAILQHNGLTKVVETGSAAEIDGVEVKVLAIDGRVAQVTVEGKTRALKLSSSGYRPLPSVKKSKTDDSKTGVKNAAFSSNSQSSSGK